MNRRAFNMIDTSLALAVALVGILGVTGTLKQVSRAFGASRHPQVAWRLLDHARTMSEQQLRQHNERYFDMMGQPTDEPDVFFFRVTLFQRTGETVFLVEVFWNDAEGVEHRLSFERKEVVGL